MNASARAVCSKFALIRRSNEIRHAPKIRSSSTNQIALTACRGRPILLQGDRGRDDAGVATRIDQIKWCKIPPNIQGKAVPGHATLHAYADGTDLAVAHPAAGRTVTPLRCNTELRTRCNQRRLECANVRT